LRAAEVVFKRIAVGNHLNTKFGNVYILKITPNNRRVGLIWEHALKTTVGFVLTFGILIFGPMLISSRRGSTKNSVGEKVIEFYLEYPATVMICSILGAILFNIEATWYNSRKHFIVAIEYDESEGGLRFDMISMYSNAKQQRLIHRSDLIIERQESKRMIVGVTKYYQFQTSTGEIIGRIDFENLIYEGSENELKKALNRLQKIKEDGSTQGV
jgi:hypothetical protein